MKRPAWVTFFGIVNIIWGVLGVCGIAGHLVMRSGLVQMPAGSNPTIELMENNTAYRLFSDISAAVGAIATIIIISAGIGLLMLRPWARLASLGWAVYSVVMTIFGSIMNWVLMFRPMLAQASRDERIGLIVGLTFSVVITLVILSYCSLMFIILMRPRIAATFRDIDGVVAESVGEPPHVAARASPKGEQ